MVLKPLFDSFFKEGEEKNRGHAHFRAASQKQQQPFLKLP